MSECFFCKVIGNGEFLGPLFLAGRASLGDLRCASRFFGAEVGAFLIDFLDRILVLA